MGEYKNKNVKIDDAFSKSYYQNRAVISQSADVNHAGVSGAGVRAQQAGLSNEIQNSLGMNDFHVLDALKSADQIAAETNAEVATDTKKSAHPLAITDQKLIKSIMDKINDPEYIKLLEQRKKYAEARLAELQSGEKRVEELKDQGVGKSADNVLRDFAIGMIGGVSQVYACCTFLNALDDLSKELRNSKKNSRLNSYKISETYCCCWGLFSCIP